MIRYPIMKLMCYGRLQVRFLLFLCLIYATLFAADKYTNALIDETSPYLLHHAHNPVDWFPYSQKALEKAKKEHKLIFLSIGYSTCHWCHVMEKESFENPKIAALLNRDYISIKVDKEEMPQIDTYYQRLHTLLNQRRGGWPLNLILTPDMKILYVSTYIPPVDKYGVEGLETILPRYAKLFKDDPKTVEAIVEANVNKIAAAAGKKRTVPDDANLTKRFVAKMWQRFDRVYKGFDRRPRFPMAAYLRVLQDIYLLTGDDKARQMVYDTLEAMAMGGIYDQIEGGFFRYTTDQDWVVPHFEKMLYTNAELIPVYVRAFLVTGNPLFKKVVTETIAMYHRQLEENHLFFGATDADSEGGEGRYFLYAYDEVKKRMHVLDLNASQKEALLEYFDITDPGNVREDLSNVQFHTGFDKVPAGVVALKKLLAKMRGERTFPFIDKKIITSWNAMMIKALLRASVLDKKYLNEGLASLEALLHKNYKDGTLYHYTIGFSRPKHIAFLEDYAFLIDAVLEAYAQTYGNKYLTLAEELATEAKQKFYKNGQWYLNQDLPPVTGRYFDKYYTTPLAQMFENLLTLAALTYDLQRFNEVKKMIADEKAKILRAFDDSPEAVRLLIRLAYGDIILKSAKTQLLNARAQIAKVRYPFLLTKPEKTKQYLLCDMQTCFFYDKNLTNVLAQIDTATYREKTRGKQDIKRFSKPGVK